MIELVNIYKSFEDKAVIKDVSLEFEPKKLNLIIGKSGSGKTVLLKMIIGLFTPSKGTILYDGREFSKKNIKHIKEIRREIGMVFQSSALFDSTTIENNVKFPLDMFTNLSNKEKQYRVDECLDTVNLRGVNKKYSSELSGGMQKRVAIARAIALKPKYLFFDEPNSGLDPVTSGVIDDMIYNLTRELDITTIINTHDMNTVMKMGEHIVFINEGTKCWEGDKSEILTSDNKYLKEFLNPYIQLQK